MEVTKTNLATYIASLTASATPYPIEITETEASDWVGDPNNASSIIQIIKDNVISGVYVDLGGTVISSSVTNLTGAFYGCTALTTAPTIPSGVTNLKYTFYVCTALTTAPTIPSSVTNLIGTFNGCTALTTAPTISSSVTSLQITFFGCKALTTVPTIPSSVTNLDSTFYGCTALTTIYLFEVDVTTCTMTAAFYNCTSLTDIYVAEATEADWHLLYTDTDATGTDYEIYDTDGTLLSSGTVTGTSQVLELSGKSDELVISDNLTSALAIESATTQLQWHHAGLPYDDELFILNAKNPTTVISNVLTTTLRRNASFTLGTYPDGKKIRIANTHATNTITCTLPSGQTMSGAGTISIPAGRIIDIELIGTTWKDNLTGHASSATTYGVSSEANYGHAKASAVAGSANGTASKGTTPTVFAQSNHVHPLQTSVSGNAGTATKLATPRKIGSVYFDGTSDIDIPTWVKVGTFSGTAQEFDLEGFTYVNYVMFCSETEVIASTFRKIETGRVDVLANGLTGAGVTYRGGAQINIESSKKTRLFGLWAWSGWTFHHVDVFAI